MTVLALDQGGKSLHVLYTTEVCHNILDALLLL